MSKQVSSIPHVDLVIVIDTSPELRVKLDSTACVDINTFKPFKPLSGNPAPLSPVQPQHLPPNR